MSNNVRKSSLEQAKADFEEIRKFAQQQIESKLQEEVDKKILEVINEEDEYDEYAYRENAIEYAVLFESVYKKYILDNINYMNY